MRGRWLGGRLVLVAVVALGVATAAGSAFATGAPRQASGEVTLLELLGFQAKFNGVNGTDYTATVFSKDKVRVTVYWVMSYTAGRCGNLTLTDPPGVDPLDSGLTQHDATIVDTPNQAGSLVSSAFYNHDGCPLEVESNAHLTLLIERRDPQTGETCLLQYEQRARDGDVPGDVQLAPPTTTHGTCTASVNPPAPPPAAAAPAMSAAEKAALARRANVLIGLGIVEGFTGIVAILIPSPDPITKGVGGSLLVLSGATFAGASALKLAAKDPPDPHYKQLATPTFRRPAPLTPGHGVTTGEATAADALLTNTAQFVGENNAFLASLQRAQGAAAARDATWQNRQAARAARFARTAAALLDARPSLDGALLRAIQAAAPRTAASVATARQAIAQIARTGLPTSLASLLRAFGVGDAETASIRAQMSQLRPVAATGRLASKLAAQAAAAAEHGSAQTLHTIAARIEPGTSPQPATPQAAISESDTWAYNPTLGKSTICINVRTTPPQASISGELIGPNGFDAKTNRTQPLHPDGTAQIRTAATAAGAYADTLTVYDTRNQQTATSTNAFVVLPPENGPTPTFGPPCPQPTQ